MWKIGCDVLVIWTDLAVNTNKSCSLSSFYCYCYSYSWLRSSGWTLFFCVSLFRLLQELGVWILCYLTCRSLRSNVPVNFILQMEKSKGKNAGFSSLPDTTHTVSTVFRTDRKQQSAYCKAPAIITLLITHTFLTCRFLIKKHETCSQRGQSVMLQNIHLIANNIYP